MGATFADSLKSLRAAQGLSQQQLANKLFVDRSTVARWETGDRNPDIAILPRIAECLKVDTATLLDAARVDDAPKVIVVDDERIALSGAIPVLEKELPGCAITGFTRPSDALAYMRTNPVDIAFLDIEMGRTSGLDLCRELLKVYPRANVVFLTAFRDYAFDAWSTGACGFLLKPLQAESVRAQLENLKHPIPGLMGAPVAKGAAVQ